MRNDMRNDIEDDDRSGPLRRVKIVPEKEIERLKRNEIGIKSDLKGFEIKQCVDNAINKLIYENHRTVTLKAIGNACTKLLSVADIIRRKVKDLDQINTNYTRKYVAFYESEDVNFHINKLETNPKTKRVSHPVHGYHLIDR